MKRILLSLIFFCCLSPVFAKHITGGEVIYDIVSVNSNNTKTYRITLLLFRDENCVGCAPMPPTATIAIFDNDTRQMINSYVNLSLSSAQTLPLNALPSCITNPPQLNYTVGYYIYTVTLPDNPGGYTVTYQTCCRIDGIANVGNSVGATYTTAIPGNDLITATGKDNSARFSQGISVVCYNKPFTLDFSATDPDLGDSLVYYLCDAYGGGDAKDVNYDRPQPPSYQSVSYINGYTGAQPLGVLATINSNTGIISGTAPGTGKYVVSVCVNTYRNGNFINTHRKDFIISVAPCDFSGSELELRYTNCKDSTFNFTNLNTSPLNISFFWDFGDGQTSTDASPTHTYADTGLYTVKLVVNKGSDCADSATSPIRVFPKFIPAFNENSPMCKGIPVQFSDQTFATYGPVDKWKWDFGIPTTLADTSRLKNPTFTYPVAGTYKVLLTSGSIKGCSDTISKIVTIVDKPPFRITNDTLICSIDTLRLIAVANNPGTITWSPNYMIDNIHSFTPLVSPDVTTTYHVTYSDNFGCSTTDSIKIRVVDFVTLSAMPDTTICRTDKVTLQVSSDALQYTWTPAATLNSATVQSPIATPTAALTNYSVTGRIGKCFTTKNIIVKTIPYPKADAGKDTSICFGFNAQLHATGGSIYNWTPSFFLNNSDIANPVSQAPTASIQYIVTVRDTLGCPKPVKDTMIVNVIRIIANAGPRDTAVVTGQPLQLNATANIPNGIYAWSPATWLNNSNIPNPVSLPQADIQYTLLVKNGIGCIGRDTINVKLYLVKPDLYVPSAFTPNGDVTNPNFKPIALGIRSLESFRVYNRWGQLLFSTSQIGVGWDGTFGGRGQETATYVWYAEATDYLGKKIKRKGSVVLIR